MKASLFSLGPDDLEEKLDHFLSELLGVEAFTPGFERLEKHFSYFKKYFKAKNIPLFIVAGTNGKGEVSLIMEDLLLKNGYSPFVWNSPHILSVRERMSYGGEAISAQALWPYFEKYKPLTSELSFYEFLLYIFCAIGHDLIENREHSRPVIIFEVGLGGRLDATNFFDCSYSVLTSISRDHMEYLGNTHSKILSEKIEVTRPEGQLVSGVSGASLRNQIKKYCLGKGVELQDLWEEEAEFSLQESDNFFARNQKTALACVTKFFKNEGISDSMCLELPENVWARPLKVTYNNQEFILLGSHNLDGIRHLAKWAKEFSFSEAWLAFSRQNPDELEQCLRIIGEAPCLGEDIILTTFDHPRATSFELLESTAKKCLMNQARESKKVKLEKDLSTLIYKSSTYEGRPQILVAGSYYFLGRFLRSLPSYTFS